MIISLRRLSNSGRNLENRKRADLIHIDLAPFAVGIENLVGGVIGGQNDHAYWKNRPYDPGRRSDRPSSSNCRQDIEHVRMSLFHLIEQDYREWFPPDRFSQHPALFIPDISRRRPDHLGHRMRFHELRHIHPNHGVLVIKQEFRQQFGQIGFSRSGRPEEKEMTPPGDWAFSIRPGPCARHWR